MVRCLQRFFAVLLIAIAPLAHAAALQPGQTYPLSFRDVDGRNLSLADGHVTIIAVVTRSSEEKARQISRLVPEHCIGDPRYRYITMVNFQRGLVGPLHGLTRAIIRGRLDGEAKEMQRKYAAKNVTRNAREDLYVVADFNGSAVTKLGMDPAANEVAVFVFNGSGKLVNRWVDVPSEEALAKAVAAAERQPR